MDQMQKAKEWINENVPMLNHVYQNKYVGMVSDRFGSLPPSQQKRVLLGTFWGFLAIFVGYLLYCYVSLWSYSSKAKEAYAGVTLLQQYQRVLGEKGSQIQILQRNSQLATPNAFKDHIMTLGRNASISPRMINVDEKPDRESEEDGKPSKEIKIKQVNVTVDKVNLAQLKSFIQNIEYGNFNLHVSSVKITNDDKIRGFMKVEIAITAYLFQSDEATQ